MPTVEVRERIGRSPGTVHAFVEDFDRYPEWNPFAKEVTSVERTDGVVGTVYTERGKGGRSTWRIVDFEPGRHEVHEGDLGIARVRIEMSMKAIDGGTDYRHKVQYEMKHPVSGWVVDKLLFGRAMRRGTRKTVANLKRLLEQDA